LIQLLFDPSTNLNDVKARLQYLSKGRSIKTNLEEAITEPYRHLERRPDDEDALMNLLVCELKLGRFKDGEQTARKLLKRTNHVQMHFWLAASLDNQGRLDEAIAAATTGMKLAPDQDTRQMFEKMIDNFSNSKPDSKGD
jgi:tetratricopeptide (TPR) repeat protein